MSGHDPRDVALYRRLADEDGDTLIVQTARTPEAIERDGADKTLSPDAIDGLRTQFLFWLGSRMDRYWRRTGRPAHEVEVKIEVTINGERQPLTMPVRLTIPDGGHRR